MVKIYGREDCMDCVGLKRACDENEIDYDFRDIGKSLREMAVFLKIRDTNEAFAQLKGTGQIGIPAIVLEDRTVILNWKNYLNDLGIEVKGTDLSCSLSHMGMNC